MKLILKIMTILLKEITPIQVMGFLKSMTTNFTKLKSAKGV